MGTMASSREAGEDLGYFIPKKMSVSFLCLKILSAFVMNLGYLVKHIIPDDDVDYSNRYEVGRL